MTKEQIKQTRKALKLKQAQFATLTNHSRHQIVMVEGGKRKAGAKLIANIERLLIENEEA